MFEVRLTKQPQKYLSKVPPKLVQGLQKCFEKLEEDPFNIAEALHGPLKGKLKVVIGSIRIIVEINIENQVVKVIYIGPRGDVYKK